MPDRVFFVKGTMRSNPHSARVVFVSSNGHRLTPMSEQRAWFLRREQAQAVADTVAKQYATACPWWVFRVFINNVRGKRHA